MLKNTNIMKKWIPDEWGVLTHGDCCAGEMLLWCDGGPGAELGLGDIDNGNLGDDPEGDTRRPIHSL